MSKQRWKPGTTLSPTPVIMATVGRWSADGNRQNCNIITLAWTGIACSEPPIVYISVRPERYSYGLLKENPEFVINLPTVSLARATDFCGVKSGRDLDKFEACRLTPEASYAVSTPSIKECPVNIECAVIKVCPLGSHDLFLGEVKSVSVDEKFMDKSGKFDFQKANPIAYSHGFYYSLGENLGRFGFSVKKK